MKRRLFLAGAVIFALASCTKDPSAPNAGGENSESTSTGAFTFLNVDQSRIVTSTGADTRSAVTRSGATAPTVAEKVPAGWESAQELTSGEHDNLAGGLYKITQSGNYELKNNIQNEVNIVIAENANITFKPANVENNYATNIYVLPGATLKMNGSLEHLNNIYCWGTLSLPEWYTMTKTSSIHYYGDEQLELKNFKTSNVNTDLLFESYAPIKFTGDYTTFEGGNFIFNGTADFYDNLTINNHTINITFNNCAHFYSGLKLNGNTGNPLTITSSYLIYLAYINVQDGSFFNINLNDSVLVIDGDCDFGDSEWDWSWKSSNVFQENTIVTGTGNSAVYILGSIIANMKNRGPIDMFKGSLAILGKPANDYIPTIHVKATNGTDNSYGANYDSYEAPFADAGVSVLNPNITITSNSTDGAQDCRASYVYNNGDIDDDEIPGAWILPPTGEHKYSATGISFNGDLVYVSWHSNLHGDAYGKSGEEQAGFGDNGYHNHGTNGDYGYPSVEGEEDWGGIIDVISVSKYSAGQGTLFEQTAHHDDFKYNHVLYNNGKLYLPATSWKVGAALNVIDLAADGKLPESNIAAASKRVNLTGYSANCVEIDNNSNVWTVSGHTYGAVNFFSTEILTAAADDEGDEEEGPKKNPLNQTENYVEIASLGTPLIGTQKVKYQSGTVEEEYTKGYENFGGKYVVLYNNAIYVLRNTESAVVSKFSLDGEFENDDIELHVSLKPNDGKNVMLIDNGTIYVCCGQNGFYAFDMEGHRVGGSMKHANGCDFDDDHIYLATGDGLAILDKHELVDATREIKDENGKVTSTEPVLGDDGQPLQVYKTVKYVHYTGKGFNYPTGAVEDGEIKESSNFVKVHNGKIYVAYGMYGLRIYDPELIPGKAE